MVMRSKANTAPNRTRCHKYTKKKKIEVNQAKVNVAQAMTSNIMLAV